MDLAAPQSFANLSVNEHQNPIGSSRHRDVMGDDHQCQPVVVELVQEVEDDSARD